MKTINQNKKSTIAKLLATENVHVVHKKTQTASFNVATRELTLPIFKNDISDDVYDMFVCHEVAHALWTPLDMLKKSHDLGLNKSVVNVLEDARIEAMIQKKYPGSVKNFTNGYKELLKQDFFGIKNQDLSKMNIIDKINIYFKTGLDVFFSDEEKKLAKKVGACKTPQDVLDLAVEIAGYHKEKKKKEEQESAGKSKMKMDDDGEKQEGAGEAGDSKEEDDQQEETSGEDENQDDQKEEDKESDTEKSKSKSAEHASAGGKSDGSELTSATDMKEKDLENGSFLNQIDDNARDRDYVNIPSKFDLTKLIIPTKQIMQELSGERYWTNKTNHYAEDAFKKWLDAEIIKLFNDNKKVVQYMVKEFEMKKSADMYKRATTSKTGMLDMNKIHTYKYNDDLFAKMTTIPGATNHGMIMYLDWSGSMAYNMRDTVKQLFNLIWFCQRTKIPYQVFAFSDQYGRVQGDYGRYGETPVEELSQEMIHNDMNIDNTRLLEYFNSNMTKDQTMTMMKYLLGFSYYWVDRRGNGTNEYDGDPLYVPTAYNLGGTPLNHSILTIPQIEKTFVEKYKVQKSNIVILTDGDSHSLSDAFRSDSQGNITRDSFQPWNKETHVTHKESGKSIVVTDGYRSEMTESLLTLVKKIKPSLTITGFFIAGSGRAGRVTLRTIEEKFKLSSYSDKKKVVEIQKELRKNRVAVCKTQGYDEYYILPSGGNSTESEELTIKPGAKVGSIKSAFAKSMNAKTVNRQLLNKFIGLVA